MMHSPLTRRSVTRRSLTRLSGLAVATVLGVSGLAACSSSGSGSSDQGSSSDSSSSSSAPSSSAPTESSSGSSSKAPEAAKTATITIKDFKYSSPSTVAPGTKITVKNEDTAAHTVTSDKAGKFDVQVPGGKSATFTAPAAGSYTFFCTYHSNMHGTLKVS